MSLEKTVSWYHCDTVNYTTLLLCYNYHMTCMIIIIGYMFVIHIESICYRYNIYLMWNCSQYDCTNRIKLIEIIYM